MNGIEASVREVFRALTAESLAHVSPDRLVSAAASLVSSAGGATSPPPEAQNDAQAAERFVCEQIRSLPDPFRALRELARVADDPHTVLFTTQGGSSMMRVVSGAPSTDPGLSFDRLEDRSPVVTEVVAGSAASRAGILPGDVVRSVFGEQPRRGIEVLARILGLSEGDRVPIEVERAGRPMALSLEVATGLLPLVVRGLAGPHLGTVRVRWITSCQDPERDVATLLRRALDELAREGARAIVLDLRGNPGGYGVTRVASVLTGSDPIAIYRHPSGEEEVATRSGARTAVRLPLCVLVDGGTSSAAEMIALCLQQHGDARIVGCPTAGGLNVPSRKSIGNDHVLMVPRSHALGPRTRTQSPGMRVVPDVVTPHRTPSDLATGRDPQLEAARLALR